MNFGGELVQKFSSGDYEGIDDGYSPFGFNSHIFTLSYHGRRFLETARFI
jgi:hypothetical protein